MVNQVSIVSEGRCDFGDLQIMADLGADLILELRSPMTSLTNPSVSVRVFLAEDCPAGYQVEHKEEGGTKVCTACEKRYYELGGECFECEPGMQCEAPGLAIRQVALEPKFWRTDDESRDVRKCRFDITSCPGDGKNQDSVYSPSQRRASSSGATTGLNPYCSPNHVGPLCSACTPDHFLSWTGDGKCYECATKDSHVPTIGLVSGVFVIVVSCLACTYKKSLKKAQGITTTTSNPTNSLFSKAKQVYILAKFKVFTLFLTSQVRLRSQPSF